MALDLVNTGSSPNDHSGDLLRDGFIKINANLEYLEDLISSGATQVELTDAIENIEAHLDVIRAEIDTKVTIGASIPLDRIIGLVNALNSKVNKSTFNSAIGNINNLISQIQEVIADLQRGSGLDHNSLSGLQGGNEIEDEFYHLSESQYNRVLGLIYINGSSTISTTPTSGERGLNTPLTVNFNLVSGDDIYSAATINQGVGSVMEFLDEGPTSSFVGSFTNNTTLTLTTSFSRKGVLTGETKSATYTTQVPQWSGISNASNLNTANYSGLTGLTKVVQASTTISRSLQPVNQYVWFVSTNANANITNNGFNTIIGDWNSTTAFFIKQTVTFTLADGVTTASLTFYRTRQTLNLPSAQNFTIS